MKLFDRVLLFFAGVSLLTIVAIFSAENVPDFSNQNLKNSEEPVITSIDFAEVEPEGAGGVDLETNAFNHETDMVVYSREIDAQIEKYFETIREHPEQAEEEARLLESENTAGPEADTAEKNAEKTGETEKPGAEVQKKKKPAAFFALHKHTVKKGESIWRIAQQYNVPVYTIVSANPKNAGRVIHPGDKLKVPNRAGVYHKVKKGETLSEIAKKFKSEIKDIRKANSISGSTLYSGSRIFIPGAEPLPTIKYVKRKMFNWPLSGRLTSSYGWRRHPVSGRKSFHTGIDIAANHGTPIKAAASGVVIFSGDGGSYGKMVILKHKKGYFTVYAHASKLLVKKGQYVKKGRRIARVGSTGLSTGPHLHFEVKKNKKRINPHSAFKKTVRVAVKTRG